MSSAVDLPPGWKRAQSKSQAGKFFFYNTSTGEKSWTPPAVGKRKTSAPANAADTRSIAKGNKAHRVAGSSNTAETCHVLHLLVKHAGSRRPSSWREPNITMGKEDARQHLEKLRIKILSDAKKAGGTAAALEAAFRERATKRSDCSSANKGGDLGRFPRGKMQPAFERGAFELRPQRMSHVVDSDSGLHLIYRIA
mmetsp:Transcript_115561/g.224917  ORF Transcript_115561/g.224917 Transcript_115561/m.224917 type:complete len:196 (+) Transcript_115561:50-637(+)